MQVDPRGLRFGATLTALVLVIVLLTGSWVLLAAQAVVFGIGTACGIRHAPYLCPLPRAVDLLQLYG